MWLALRRPITPTRPAVLPEVSAGARMSTTAQEAPAEPDPPPPQEAAHFDMDGAGVCVRVAEVLHITHGCDCDELMRAWVAGQGGVSRWRRAVRCAPSGAPGRPRRKRGRARGGQRAAWSRRRRA